MAKGKSLNPADAQRKQERKKELKKNKNERQKARDFALVKKDTSSMEEDIERLEKAELDGVISATQKGQLNTIREELTRINKKKEEYVAEHPEHRRLVYRARYKKAEDGEKGEDDSQKKERKIFNKNGLPRHPERSVYYDPVMNPFGVPPPGMPYMERPLRADEVDSQAEDESSGDDDDDIVLPAGPPPSNKETNVDIDNKADEDTDDDIPMPEGPPPSALPPLPPGPPPLITPQAQQYYPPPPPPSGFPVAQPTSFPPFPPSFPLSQPLSEFLPPPPVGLPPPPRWMHPSSEPRLQSDSSMQDPLAPVPHQTFQSYHTQQAHPLPNRPTNITTISGPANHLPPRPSASASASSAASASTAGTISAPAQLRDLKKESTAFMPSSLKRKKAGGVSASGSSSKQGRINAAPDASGTASEGAGDARPDLLDTLRSNFPAPAPRSNEADDTVTKKRKIDIPEAKKDKSDYERFMEEMGDILER